MPGERKETNFLTHRKRVYQVYKRWIPRPFRRVRLSRAIKRKDECSGPSKGNEYSEPSKENDYSELSAEDEHHKLSRADGHSKPSQRTGYSSSTKATISGNSNEESS